MNVTQPIPVLLCYLLTVRTGFEPVHGRHTAFLDPQVSCRQCFQCRRRLSWAAVLCLPVPSQSRGHAVSGVGIGTHGTVHVEIARVLSWTYFPSQSLAIAGACALSPPLYIAKPKTAEKTLATKVMHTSSEKFDAALLHAWGVSS